MVQQFVDVVPRQFLTIKEPCKLTAHPRTKGVINLTLEGGRGLAYTVERSTDLKQWISIASFTNQTGRVVWTNTPSTLDSPSFYRATEN